MRPLAQIADDIIGVKIETARSRYFRIKLAKRARREISGICVNLLPFFYSLLFFFFFKLFFFFFFPPLFPGFFFGGRNTPKGGKKKKKKKNFKKNPPGERV